MNNLNHCRSYIAGPVEYLNNRNLKEEYFSELYNFLENKHVKAIDPLKIKYDNIEEVFDREQLFKENSKEQIRERMKAIVRKDLRCVDISDFIIAFLPKDVKTVGTIHEIIESDRQKKPTLLICPEGTKYISTWLYGIIPLQYMFGDLHELIQYLEDIDCGKTNDDRWQFIIKNVGNDILYF